MAENSVNDNKGKNIHKGHREKVKQRYYEAGLGSMPDHNILEMLLFFGIPQKDTNPIAHELMEKFGSFSGVLEAGMTELKSVKGMTETAACLLTLFLPVYKRYVSDLRKKKLQFKNAKEIADYLRPLYLDTNNERIYALCFDLQDRLIACRVVSDGDIDSSVLDARKLAAIVLEVKAKRVILSHNHPSGTLEPSIGDSNVTKYAFDLLRMLKVQLMDHIIVTDTSYFSMIKSPSHIHLFYGAEPLFTSKESD